MQAYFFIRRYIFDSSQNVFHVSFLPSLAVVEVLARPLGLARARGHRGAAVAAVAQRQLVTGRGVVGQGGVGVDLKKLIKLFA